LSFDLFFSLSSIEKIPAVFNKKIYPDPARKKFAEIAIALEKFSGNNRSTLQQMRV